MTQEPNGRGFAGTLGGSFEYGRLGDSGMGLSDRSMNSLSLEALPGYRFNSKWLLGVDFNYRLQSQITSLSDTGGTNLKGKGWLFGLGAQYRINESWVIQAAVDLLGRYNFDQQTAASEDDHLASPLSLRVKGQYFFRECWSVDASANYIRWADFHVAGVDHSEPASQWMIGAGITYHFGWPGKARAEAPTK